MSPFPFDLAVFDLDGTIADTSPDIAAALNHALAALGRPAIPKADVKAMIGGGTRTLLRKGLAACGGAADEALVAQALPHFLDFYADHICIGSAAFPGLAEALDDLAARGVALAVCTNKIERLTFLLLDALGLTGLFCAIVGGDTCGVQKPDPAPLLEAIRRGGGGRAVMIGDSITDADTARAAGVPFVAVTFGFRDRPADQLGAAALIDRFDQLVPALAAL